MNDFIRELELYGFTARIKRLSDTLASEARNIYKHLEFEIEPNWHLLFLLLEKEELSITEVSERLGFSHPAIIKITQRMGEKGYLEVKRDTNDSRRKILSLSQKSKHLLPSFKKEWDKIRAVVRESVTPDLIEQIGLFESVIQKKSLLERFKERDD